MHNAASGSPRRRPHFVGSLNRRTLPRSDNGQDALAEICDSPIVRDVGRENAMPRTKLSVPDVAEAGPGLWSNAIRAGDTLYISGQVARPFEGGTGMVGKDEYEQARQIFSRIDRIIKAAGGTMDNLVKMTIYVVDIRKNTEVW